MGPSALVRGHPRSLSDSPGASGCDDVEIRVAPVEHAYRLTLRNGVLIHRKAEADPNAAATITTTKPRLLGVMAGDTSSPGLDITGDAGALTALPSRSTVPRRGTSPSRST